MPSLDPTHFREARCGLKITWKGVFVYCELEIHFCDILLVGNQTDPKQHYNFFRRRLAGTVPESALDPHRVLPLEIPRIAIDCD